MNNQVFVSIPLEIDKFAFISDSIYQKLIETAKDENWETKEVKRNKKGEIIKYPLLKNYIIFTYQRLAELYNCDQGKRPWIVFSDNKNQAIINTGLQTKFYRRIYLGFQKTEEGAKNLYFCKGVYTEDSNWVLKFQELPIKAKYIENLDDLLYDTNLPLVANNVHILSDQRNMDRLPESLKNSPSLLNTFEGALNIVKRKVEQNYRIAIPQYHKGKIQLLLPICLQDTETPDLVLVVSRVKKSYRGNTCLTLDMAYNNARLIAKPENNWLSR